MESPVGLHPVPNANGGLFLLPHPRPDLDQPPPDAPPALFPFLHPRVGFDEAKTVTEPDNFSRFDSHPFLHHHHQQHQHHQHHRQLSHEGSMRELEDLLSKLNPLAKEFVPPSLAHDPNPSDEGDVDGDGNGNGDLAAAAGDDNHRRKKNSYSQGKRRVNGRISRAQREDVVRRTVYVSDIDQQVTEEQLAALFIACSPVVDCRVCGDPNSVLRFAFVEFMSEDGARAALRLSGTMLGFYPLRVLPSKTAIVPVNPHLLPQSEDERQMCVRTVYCTNIDKKVSQADVKLFFESLCGEVLRLRLLGDYHHSTRIAFVEFLLAESAMNALNCSGAILGSLPIRDAIAFCPRYDEVDDLSWTLIKVRVNPSKTPVRPRTRTRSH